MIGELSSTVSDVGTLTNRVARVSVESGYAWSHGTFVMASALIPIIGAHFSFQCCGVLLPLYIVGQGPAVLVAGTGRVGYIYFFIFSIYLPFLMPYLLGAG